MADYKPALNRSTMPDVPSNLRGRESRAEHPQLYRWPFLAPSMQVEERRIQHTAARDLMLSEDADEAVRQFQRDVLGEQLAGLRGDNFDRSSNDLLTIVRQLTTPGTAGSVPDLYGDDAVLIAQALELGGYWPCRQNAEFRAVGKGAHVIRVGVRDDVPVADFRGVCPSNCWATPWPGQPSEPMVFRELRVFEVPDVGGKRSQRYCWEVYDLNGSDGPEVRVVLQDSGGCEGRDVTADVWPAAVGYRGDAYPYRYGNGEPYIPYRICRTHDSGDMWNWRAGRSAFFGSCAIMVLLTQAQRVAQFASGKAVILIDGTPGGARSAGKDYAGNPMSVLPILPGCMIEVASVEAAQGQARVEEIGPGGDIRDIADVALMYRQTILEQFGVSTDNVTRGSGNSVVSGASLHVTHQQKRLQQERTEPMWRTHDLAIIRMVAAQLNRVHGVGIAEEGYSIRYHRIPLSPDETRARREDQQRRREMGLANDVDLYIEDHPGMGRAEAMAQIVRMRAEQAELERQVAATQPRQED